jgi:SAM-dependent methyltransferase
LKDAAVIAELSRGVRDAFDRLAPCYDSAWTNSLVGRLQRRAVWRAADRVFAPCGRILDLGCGTGADTVHLARRGHAVHAVDVSPEMVALARERLAREGLAGRAMVEELGIEELTALADAGPFDGVLSNFSPLNCVSRLETVAEDLAAIVRPGGLLVLCLMSRFCLWETLWYPVTGQLYKAARRWRDAETLARLAASEEFPLFYHSTRRLRRAFAPFFGLRQTIGIGVLVPPSYVEPLGSRFPRALRAFAAADRLVAGWPGVRSMGDHRLFILERKSPLPRAYGLEHPSW